MAISMLIEGSSVEKLRWSFQLYDKDRDGAITREEMLEIMQVGGHSRPCTPAHRVQIQLCSGPGSLQACSIATRW